MSDPTYALYLALATILGAVVAFGAIAFGLWMAGKLTGVLGKPMMAVDQDNPWFGGGEHTQADDTESGPETVPWEGPEPPQEGVDLGADPDKWEQA